MRKRTFAVLVLFWGALSAVIWRAFEPLAREWISPRLSGFAPNDANLIASIAAAACPLAISATVILVIFLLARPATSKSERVQPATRAVPTVHPVARKIIRINPDKTLVHSGLRFGLVRVANGKDETHALPQSEEIYFKKLDDRGTLIAQVPYDQRFGFQFKCFVDYKGMTLERVKNALAVSGYAEAAPKTNKQFRAWFVLPNYKRIKTGASQRHNIVQPI
jgi:hypothetical protein